MNASPLLTVGVPVYNGEKYLAQTLESLLNQSLDDFKIIVSDNASTDSSFEIAKQFEANDPRVKAVQHEKNLGPANNYNYCLQQADTKYFRWSAADDMVKPRFSQDCVNVLEDDDSVVLAYPGIQLIDESDKPLGIYDEGLHLPYEDPVERFFGFLDRVKLVNAFYGLMRTNIAKSVAPMTAQPGSDNIFQAELTLYGKFTEIPEVLFLRRMHSDSSTSMTLDEVQDFYNPDGAVSSNRYYLKHLRANLGSVWRSPLPIGSKMRLVSGLARRANWQRKDLAKELATIVTPRHGAG